jgi:hypothetical protein
MEPSQLPSMELDYDHCGCRQTLQRNEALKQDLLRLAEIENANNMANEGVGAGDFEETVMEPGPIR